MSSSTDSALLSYYRSKIEQLELKTLEKFQNIQRLEA